MKNPWRWKVNWSLSGVRRGDYNGEGLFNAFRVSFLGDKSVLKLGVVAVAKSCKQMRNH